jgi:hypothetical protein
VVWSWHGDDSCSLIRIPLQMRSPKEYYVKLSSR